ncbi:SURF1 family protein [Brachybacterium paraconglomeratum]|uniref:SURF1 family protein n=1 Tax=Brachybacterium paraconglomeratum TaxID=173362 RepID=UPI0031EFB35E
MLRVALRPRFLGLLALMVVATLVCGLLATWQWDRAHQAITDKAAGSEQLGDIRDVVGVGDAVTNSIVGATVTAVGTYVPDEQVIVPGRNIGGTEAVLVVSSLRIELEDGSQGRLPVLRGWIPSAELTGEDGQVDPALAPAPPQGEVEISGRLEASEAASGGVVDGVAREIATPMLVNEWGSPMFAGYVSLDEPTGVLRPVPAAESEFSRGLDWQNIGYSLQWVMFGAFFLYLWWRSVRTAHLDEVADRREAMERLLAESGSSSPASPSAASPAVVSARSDHSAASQLSSAGVGSSSSSAATATTEKPSDKDV